jgi:hypothetical protein
MDDAIMDEGFAALMTRLTKLRITEAEFVKDHVGISAPTYWRARENNYTKPGSQARLRVLRDCEAALDRLEAERASA